MPKSLSHFWFIGLLLKEVHADMAKKGLFVKLWSFLIYFIGIMSQLRDVKQLKFFNKH